MVLVNRYKFCKQMIPSVKACLSLFEQYQMLPNIQQHSIMVARIAAKLTDDLADSSLILSKELIIAGALLHDIGKTSCLKTMKNHARQGRKICKSHNFNRIADIVGQHIVLNNYYREPVTETDIVYYADKRVNHQTLVSLDLRLDYLKKRYGRKNKLLCLAIELNIDRCRKVEARIFSRLNCSPDQLIESQLPEISVDS
jgi:uncharacterized protein